VSDTFNGVIANIFSRAVRNGSNSLMFRLDVAGTPFLLAFEEGTRGYESIQVGVTVEVTATPPQKGNQVRIARSVRIADHKVACDVDAAEQAIQDGLF
jgi:hypothetical protein